MTTAFQEAVYARLREVPRGRVVTYGELARAVGSPGSARAVGNALHRNPAPDLNPCFRVVKGDGSLAEGFAYGGTEGQERRLRADGISVRNGRVDLVIYGWIFPPV